MSQGQEPMPTWTTRIGWPPDLLEAGDLSSVALEELLDLAAQMKAEPAGWTGALPGQSLACVFEAPSARERVLAEAAAHRLGMEPVVLSAAELDDPTAVSEYATAVAAVGKAHATLKRLAAELTVPVVNARSPQHHPCHALADLLTLRDHFGGLAGVALAYVGDGDTNIARSLMAAGALAGMDVRVACPPDHMPAPEARVAAEARADLHGGRVVVTDDPRAAVEGADAAYSAASSHDDDALHSYRLDGRLLRLAKKEAVRLHSLPAPPGPGLVAGRRSLASEQSASRLPLQEAAVYALVTVGRREPAHA
jgi:ornithine carbamoyltransferase